MPSNKDWEELDYIPGLYDFTDDVVAALAGGTSDHHISFSPVQMFIFHTFLTHLNAGYESDGSLINSKAFLQCNALYSRDYMYDTTWDERPPYSDYQLLTKKLYVEKIAWVSSALEKDNILGFCDQIDAYMWPVNFNEGSPDQIELQAHLLLNSILNMSEPAVVKTNYDTQMFLLLTMSANLTIQRSEDDRVKFRIPFGAGGSIEVEVTPLEWPFDLITLVRLDQAKYSSFSEIFERHPIMKILKEVNSRFRASQGSGKRGKVRSWKETSAIPMSFVSDVLSRDGKRKLLPLKYFGKIFHDDQEYSGVSEIEHHGYIEIENDFIYTSSATYASINEHSQNKTSLTIEGGQDRTMVFIVHDHCWNVVVSVAHVPIPIT